MIKEYNGDLYYCVECDGFHHIMEFIKKDYDSVVQIPGKRLDTGNWMRTVTVGKWLEY